MSSGCPQLISSWPSWLRMFFEMITFLKLAKTFVKWIISNCKFTWLGTTNGHLCIYSVKEMKIALHTMYLVIFVILPAQILSFHCVSSVNLKLNGTSGWSNFTFHSWWPYIYIHRVLCWILIILSSLSKELLRGSLNKSNIEWTESVL